MCEFGGCKFRHGFYGCKSFFTFQFRNLHFIRSNIDDLDEYLELLELELEKVKEEVRKLMVREE